MYIEKEKKEIGDIQLLWLAGTRFPGSFPFPIYFSGIDFGYIQGSWVEENG